MGLFNKYENVNDQIVKVDKWIDENYSFFSFSYFEIRALVKSALDNNLQNEFPKCPFSARDIILWAKWNDDESILMTAGAQAIEGEKIADFWTGAPEVNPLTNEKNTKEDIDGALATYSKSALLGVGSMAVIGIFAFSFISSYASKMGGK